MNSLMSLEANVGGASGLPLKSPGLTALNNTTARAAPRNSKNAYGMHQPNPKPALDKSIPIATAGLKQPPETLPAPYAPAMMTKPIARPYHWLPSPSEYFLATATLRTTKHSMKVYRVSHKPDEAACKSGESG